MSGDASHVEKKIRTGGWSFIKIANPSLRSGIGETSQEAVASALTLALRRIGEHFNAVEVARIRIDSYRIQQRAMQPIPHVAACAPMASLQRRRRLHAGRIVSRSRLRHAPAQADA